MNSPAPKQLPKIACNWDTFEKLFEAIPMKGGNLIRDRRDIPLGVPNSHVWTVLDCDGKLYVSAGWHYVNRLGYLISKNGRADADHQYPDYRYN